MPRKQMSDGPGLFGGGDEPGLFGAVETPEPAQVVVEDPPQRSGLSEVAVTPHASRDTLPADDVEPGDSVEPSAPAYDPKKLAVMLRCFNVMPTKLRAMEEIGGIVCEWQTPMRGPITIVSADVEVRQRHGPGKTAFTAELVDCRQPVTEAEAKAWGWSPIPHYMKSTCVWVLKDIKAVERPMSVPASWGIYVVKAGPSGWEIVNHVA